MNMWDGPSVGEWLANGVSTPAASPEDVELSRHTKLVVEDGSN